MNELYQKLAKYHAARKAELEEENAFLWSRLVSLVEMVISKNYGDGSGEKFMREEADACLKELIEHISHD